MAAPAAAAAPARPGWVVAAAEARAVGECGGEPRGDVEGESDLGLVCAACGAPICLAEEIMDEKAVIMKEAVFCYELDVCGREDVWCYSATNPGANRFDVVRVDAQRLSPSGDTMLDALRVTGACTTDHSWFPPYGWRMCACAACDAHLGWAFALSGETLAVAAAATAADEGRPPAAEAPRDAAVEFCGLVVTRLRQGPIPRRKRGGHRSPVPLDGLLSLRRRRSRLLGLLRALGVRLGALDAPPPAPSDDDDDEDGDGGDGGGDGDGAPPPPDEAPPAT